MSYRRSLGQIDQGTARDVGTAAQIGGALIGGLIRSGTQGSQPPAQTLTPPAPNAPPPPQVRTGLWIPFAVVGGGLLATAGIAYWILKKPVAPNRRRKRVCRNAERLQVGDVVTLPAGHQIGMGRLKNAVSATVESVHQRDDGEFYRVWWTEKGKRRSTYVNAEEVKKNGRLRRNKRTPQGELREAESALHRAIAAARRGESPRDELARAGHHLDWAPIAAMDARTSMTEAERASMFNLQELMLDLRDRYGVRKNGVTAPFSAIGVRAGGKREILGSGTLSRAKDTAMASWLGDEGIHSAYVVDHRGNTHLSLEPKDRRRLAANSRTFQRRRAYRR